ncbi:pyocin activator PrtN family protein [Pseudomonas sp. BN515]|uniref:pyocin activator PrtN family protein n=1 Tax=Pseudomonas sp. BN515 TaxID=2567892 RepID=UPI002454E064|nr:pyocin activator PrtN family protein [Pseudomonas sp. BN515]MDH4873041.1 transcriptional regulator [Pseudomonas sp. BN515]
MSHQHDNQQRLNLLAQPRPMTVDMLFRMFGTVLIPLEDVRAKMFRNLNEKRFRLTVGTRRLPIPVTTVDGSSKALPFIEIHQLAAYIEHRATLADEDLVRLLNSSEVPELEAEED